MCLGDRTDELDVGLHVERASEIEQRFQYRIRKSKNNHDHNVDRCDREEQSPFTRLAVVHLPESRNDRHHCRNIGIAR